MRILRKANSQVARNRLNDLKDHRSPACCRASRRAQGLPEKNSADRSMLDKARGATPGSSA